MAQAGNQLFLKVHNRDQVTFEGFVESLSSINDNGVFDVLRDHTNFITLIRDGLTIRIPGGEVREIGIKDGIMKVEGGKIDVYTGVRF